jgi:hypothetical protein
LRSSGCIRAEYSRQGGGFELSGQVALNRGMHAIWFSVKGVFLVDQFVSGGLNMMKVETTPAVESLVADMRRLSEKEQRVLVGVILQDRKLEPFVEELEDHLSCERAKEDPEEPIPLSAQLLSL